MAAQIHSGLTDDNDFVELLNSLLFGLLKKNSPKQLWIIQIDNWFDHKWLGFSGNGSVLSPFPKSLLRLESVKKAFYKDKLTFPPFNPNRVLGQWSYMRRDEVYVEAPLSNLPNKTERQWSERNLNRRVEGFAQSACFLWYSANTLKNGRGSVMVYTVNGSSIQNWFASFSRATRWNLDSVKGVNRADVEELMQAK